MANNPFKSFVDPLTALWQARAPREQRVIALAGGVIVCALVYLTVYEPAAQGIAQLQATLPKTQADATAIELLTQQLQSQPKSSTSDFASQAGITRSLDALGIKAKVSATAPWVVTFTDSPAEPLWQWLKTAPVNQASFKRANTGLWQGNATVAP